RQLVLLVDLIERPGFALGLEGQLLRISTGLADVALRILLGGANLLEGGVDRFGRIGALDRHTLYQNSGAIAVENPLDRLHDLTLDLSAAIAHRIPQADPRDHRPHRAFGDLADGFLRVG